MKAEELTQMLTVSRTSAGECLNWLLEKDNPSIRYFTLRDLLRRRENDPELLAAKAAISTSRPVTGILAKQNLSGYWESAIDPYLPKYRSSYWQIMVLGYLGADGYEPRIRKACENIFQYQDDEGGFSSYSAQRASEEYETSKLKGKSLPESETWVSRKVFEHQYSCLTGNTAAALIRLGFIGDKRVEKALKWLVRVQNRDGGWLCPYWPAHSRDKHGCFYGTICPLEAFSEVPENSLTSEMKEAVHKGAEFLLMHRLFKADHHDYAVINQSWLKLGFPWFYGYNILRGLDVLTKLGYVEDAGLNDAVGILLKKRGRDGKWILESSPTGRMQTNLEKVGNPSKWITLMSLRTLKRLQRLEMM